MRRIILESTGMQFARQQQIRLRKFTELLAFGIFGLLLYEYGPAWRLPRFVQYFFLAAITLTAFVLYRVSHHAIREHFRVEKEPAAMPKFLREHRQYQVPRRFGLLTIGFATLGIALLAGLFESVGMPQIMTVLILGFLAVVAMLQGMLERVPRSASILAGTVYAMSIAAYVVWRNPIPAHQAVTLFFVAAILGPFFGYLAGAFIAGLFLAADALQNWWKEQAALDTDLETRQSPWD